jgi:hypothetical protein
MKKLLVFVAWTGLSLSLMGCADKATTPAPEPAPSTTDDKAADAKPAEEPTAPAPSEAAPAPADSGKAP